MRRREVITLLSGAAVGWLLGPPVALGQQVGKVYRIGYLSYSISGANPHFHEAFRQGLRELGWVEGQNITIDPRFAEGRSDRLPDLAAELVRLKVDIIVATSTEATLAAKNATGIIFTDVIKLRVGGLVISTDPLFTSWTKHLATLAARHGVPAAFARHEFTATGGLLSYGTDAADAYRLAGIYTGRILKGEKPADLAVQQSTKVELSINVKTAKALGLTIPPTLLARADEVIE